MKLSATNSIRRVKSIRNREAAQLRFYSKDGTDWKTFVDLKGPKSALFVKALGKTQLSSAPALSATDFFLVIVSAGMLQRWKLPGYHMNFFCHLILTRREGPRRPRPAECSKSVRCSIYQSVTAWKVAVLTVQHSQASRQLPWGGKCRLQQCAAVCNMWLY